MPGGARGGRRQGPAQQGGDGAGAPRPPRPALGAHGHPVLRHPGPPRRRPAQQGHRVAHPRRRRRHRRATVAGLLLRPPRRRRPLLLPAGCRRRRRGQHLRHQQELRALARQRPGRQRRSPSEPRLQRQRQRRWRRRVRRAPALLPQRQQANAAAAADARLLRRAAPELARRAGHVLRDDAPAHLPPGAAAPRARLRPGHTSVQRRRRYAAVAAIPAGVPSAEVRRGSGRCHWVAVLPWRRRCCCSGDGQCRAKAAALGLQAGKEDLKCGTQSFVFQITMSWSINCNCACCCTKSWLTSKTKL